MLHSNIQKRDFTLVELMVAMGVLVIMMGFLFQFTIGAQRIWNASSKQTISFSSAQVLMDVLGEDLQNMRFSNDPGETLPFYLHKDSSGNFTMGFFAHFTPGSGVLDANTSEVNPASISQVGVYPVIYYYDNSAHTVHRCALDKSKYVSSSGTEKTFSNLWFLCGGVLPPSQNYFSLLQSTFLDGDSLNQFDILAEEVYDFKLDVFFGNANDEETNASIKSFDPSASSDGDGWKKHYASIKPISVRIKFVVETNIDENKNTQEETKRSFSKVLFL